MGGIANLLGKRHRSKLSGCLQTGCTQIRLADGEPYLFVFPAYVAMRQLAEGQLVPEPVGLPIDSVILIYTDTDGALRSFANQEFTDMVPMPVNDEIALRKIIDHYEKRTHATHLGIDVLIWPGAAGGHVVPISVALGR